MFTNDHPTRRKSIRNGVRLLSQDQIQITLSHCNGSKNWLQVKSHSISASTRSSVFVFQDNDYLIVRYLENVSGIVRCIEESNLDAEEKQEALEKAIKHMASVDYFKHIH